MRILVAGGTGFLGGAIADAAVAAGHEVLVLTRGGKAIGAGRSAIFADRNLDLSALAGIRVDAVIDTCAFEPIAVKALLQAVKTDHYSFVSSASVYADFSTRGVSETSKTLRASPEELAKLAALDAGQRGSAAAMGALYGPMKREAEIAAEMLTGGRALLIRAGLLVGPGDRSDRFTWWVRRGDQGGPVAVPGRPERQFQLIDVRDAADFILRAAERGDTGPVNLSSQPLPFRDLFDAIDACTGRPAVWHWVEDQVAQSAGVVAWSEAPLWIPEDLEGWQHFLEIDVSRAFELGLKIRTLQDTVRDTLAWDRTRRDETLKTGITLEHEQSMLAAVRQ
jgi:2'-hydroxyisoflavone reductase